MSAPIHVQAAALVGRYGMHLVEVPYGSKVPKRDRWQIETIATPEAAEAHWRAHPDDNIGVVLGPSKLCSIDVDDVENTKLIFSEFGIDIEEYARLYTSCRGNPERFKVFFRVPEGMDFQRHVISWPRKDDPSKKSVVFEIRGGAGQDILPPSRHPGGYPYEWICKPNGSIAEIPELLQTIILQWDVFKKNATALCPWTSPPEPAPRTVSRSDAPQGSVIDAWNAAHDLRATLQQHGYEPQGPRFLSPHSGTKLAGVVVLPDGQRCYIHHASDPLCSEESGRPVGCFDLFCHYEHGGDVRKAVKAAAEILGMPPLERMQPEPAAARVSDYTPNHPDMVEVRDVWPEPIDVFSRAAVPALPRGIVPPAIEQFIFDQSEIVGSDPCILAVSALVCAAACCHDSIKLQPRRYDPDWKESARLWGAFVGDPSVKKTPALSRAMSHVRKLDIEMAEECEAAMPAYRVAEKRYKKAEDKAADNPSLPIPEPPERPPNRRLIAEDTTIEKLSDLLVDNRGGLLIHHDELSGFFGSFDAYRSNGGKDQAFWLQAYNGGSRRVDRISRGSIVVPNLSVCIVGGIQPDKIREMASKLADDGLVQRFMVTIASETAGIGSDRPPDRGAVQAYRSILDWLVKERGQEEPIRLSDGALDVMRDVEERLKAYRSLGSMPTRLRSHLGKWDGLFCRLCLLYHAIESVERGESPAGMVSQDNAERVRLWLITYLLPHTMAFYDDILGNSGALAHVQWVAGYILAKPDESEVSNRDLYRAYRAWRPMQDVAKWQIMGTLETCGWLRPHPDTKPHSAASRWVINPSVRSVFSELGAAEKEKRDVAKARLLQAFMNGS